MADLWEYGIKDANDTRLDPLVYREKVLDLDTNGGKNATIGYLSRVREMNEALAEQGKRAQENRAKLEAGYLLSMDEYRDLHEWYDGGYGGRPKHAVRYILVRRRVEAWQQAPNESAWTKETT